MSSIQKSKYKKFYRKNSKASIDVNLKGFLCSCNNREKECVREAYNLLNKYAELLYSNNSKVLNNAELSIEDELQMEISGLKSEKRFQQVESGAKNFLFIKTTLENPVELAQKIMADIKSSGANQTRFLIRLIPIEVTCKAYVKDISIAFKPLSQKYFKDEPTTYSIVYNHRNNDNINRIELVQAVGAIVTETNSENKVDLKNANVSIIIEVIRGIALIGVIPDFIKYKKYNLMSIVEQDNMPNKLEDGGQEKHALENVKDKPDNFTNKLGDEGQDKKLLESSSC
ncbi:THUMP domain-containing protein 1 homolog [Diorhabda carinulata]|uniref:THUMP domain-containing protein 1 homolog n=1 Tax=Diorhabda carinulata TaxID=1163345 RepID=UPI0025A30C4B|nr:THUMP domain-containing protein 1 homolog [Diorhabda carinulata]